VKEGKFEAKLSSAAMQTQIITNETKDLASSTIAQAFIAGEPMVVALGLTVERMKATIDIFMDDVVQKQSGWIVLGENSEVYGALICRDYALPVPTVFTDLAAPPIYQLRMNTTLWSYPS